MRYTQKPHLRGYQREMLLACNILNFGCKDMQKIRKNKKWILFLYVLPFLWQNNKKEERKEKNEK